MSVGIDANTEGATLCEVQPELGSASSHSRTSYLLLSPSLPNTLLCVSHHVLPHSSRIKSSWKYSAISVVRRRRRRRPRPTANAFTSYEGVDRRHALSINALDFIAGGGHRRTHVLNYACWEEHIVRVVGVSVHLLPSRMPHILLLPLTHPRRAKQARF